MKLFSAFCLLLFAAGLAFAQPVKLPATPKACDVVYTMEAETADGNDVANTQTAVYGLPWADVLDNSRKGRRVIDLASLLQDKGGPYTITMSEVRACDGGPATQVVDNSIEVRGVTLQGSNRLSRLTIQVASETTARYESRAYGGNKRGWDHDKARKVKRNDVHQKQW